MKKRTTAISRGGGVNKSSDFALLAIVGTSPAVLTETVWRLAVPGKGCDGRIPSEVVVLSTSVGAGIFRKSLLSTASPRKKSVWNEMLDNLESKYGFHVNDLRDRLEIRSFKTGRHTKDGYDVEMDDTRDNKDCMFVADQMLTTLFELQKKHKKVVVSVAGGRKAMTALMFSCVTLCGRTEDEVCHVLLDPKFECLHTPTYYYPDQTDQKIVFTPRKGTPFTQFARNIVPDLFFIPFASFRRHYEPELEHGDWSYCRLVEKCKQDRRSEDAYIKVDFRDRSVTVKLDGNSIKIAVGDKFHGAAYRTFAKLLFCTFALVCADRSDNPDLLAIAEKLKWFPDALRPQTTNITPTNVSTAFSELRKGLSAKGWIDCDDLFPVLRGGTKENKKVKFDRNRVRFLGLYALKSGRKELVDLILRTGCVAEKKASR